jgi:hypothetical protein
VSALAGAWWLSQLATAALLASLIFRRLARHYPLLAALIAAQVLRSLALVAFTGGPASDSYGRLWLITEPLLVGLRTSAAVEAYRLLAARFSRMGPWIAAIPLAGAALASAAVWWTWGEPGIGALHGKVVAVARASWAILAVAWALVWWWMARAVPLPPAASPTAARHAAVLMLYFVSQALPYATAHLAGADWVPAMSILALCGAAVAQLAWCMLLSAPVGDVRLPSSDLARERELHAEAERLLGAVDRLRARD